MGIFDFLGNVFGSSKANLTFACPNCKHAGLKTVLKRCPQCSLKFRTNVRRKCLKCGAANHLDAGKCHKCHYNLASDKRIDFIYRCSVCGKESGGFFSVCPVCGGRII